MFPIVLLNAKTKTGLELALKCIEFSGTESVNSEEPVLKFKYAVVWDVQLDFDLSSV